MILDFRSVELKTLKVKSGRVKMSTILMYFLLIIGTAQWVSAENPYGQRKDIASKDFAIIADHGTNLYEDDVGYSLLDELRDEFSNNNFDTMATLDDDMSVGQTDRHDRRRLEDLIQDKRFELGEMRDDSSGPSCSTCYGNDLASCAKKAHDLKCTSNKQCYTLHLTIKATGQKSVIKGCLDAAKCQSNVCKKITNSSKGHYSFCNAKCCKGDLCNKHSAPKVGPTPVAPKAPKCRHCQGMDEASCEARTTIKQCNSDHKCAAVYVVRKNDGQGILAKGCIKQSICDSGLCKTLTKSGKYGFCKGACCVGNLCTKKVDTKPTTKPPTTQAPVSTGPPKLKCYACYGKSQQECDQGVTVKECEVGQRCYSAQATVKSNGRTTFVRNCAKIEPKDCQSFCKKNENAVTNCSYNCCEGSLCNRPDGFTTPSTKPITNGPVTIHTYTQPIVTQRPFTGTGMPLMCYHCNSHVSEEDCEGKRVLRQCSGDRVCYTGRANYINNGKIIIAKGCMRPEECHTACKRLGENIKDCNVFCCRNNSCNAMKVTPTTPTPRTVNPTIRNPSLRALVNLIQAFRILLGAIETSVRVSATDFKASDYKPQIEALMNQIDAHAVALPIKKNPAVKEAKKKMSQLRRRAKDVLGKIENIRKRRNTRNAQ